MISCGERIRVTALQLPSNALGRWYALSLEHFAPAPSRSGRSFRWRLCLKPLLGDGKFITERDPRIAKKHAEHFASMQRAVEFDELEDLVARLAIERQAQQRLPDLHHGSSPLSRRGLDWGDSFPAIVRGRIQRERRWVFRWQVWQLANAT
jgi:hypothetical protein